MARTVTRDVELHGTVMPAGRQGRAAARFRQPRPARVRTARRLRHHPRRTRASSPSGTARTCAWVPRWRASRHASRCRSSSPGTRAYEVDEDAIEFLHSGNVQGPTSVPVTCVTVASRRAGAARPRRRSATSCCGTAGASTASTSSWCATATTPTPPTSTARSSGRATSTSHWVGEVLTRFDGHHARRRQPARRVRRRPGARRRRTAWRTTGAIRPTTAAATSRPGSATSTASSGATATGASPRGSRCASGRRRSRPSSSGSFPPERDGRPRPARPHRRGVRGAMNDFGDLDGAAIVTGGSGGLGAAVCRLLAERGSDVALTYRGNEAAARAVAADVEASGRRADVGAGRPPRRRRDRRVRRPGRRAVRRAAHGGARRRARSCARCTSARWSPRCSASTSSRR